ncbi:hypothetical protein PM082_016812 [Marasmius tenuissimus]|nr:hypothetical protein PM082_016812 [Marasmius tenuissimus]
MNLKTRPEVGLMGLEASTSISPYFGASSLNLARRYLSMFSARHDLQPVHCPNFESRSKGSSFLLWSYRINGVGCSLTCWMRVTLSIIIHSSTLWRATALPPVVDSHPPPESLQGIEAKSSGAISKLVGCMLQFSQVVIPFYHLSTLNVVALCLVNVSIEEATTVPGQRCRRARANARRLGSWVYLDNHVLVIRDVGPSTSRPRWQQLLLVLKIQLPQSLEQLSPAGFSMPLDKFLTCTVSVGFANLV